MPTQTNTSRFFQAKAGIIYGLFFAFLYFFYSNFIVYQTYIWEYTAYLSIMFSLLGFTSFWVAGNITLSKLKALTYGSALGSVWCIADGYFSTNFLDNAWGGMFIIFLPVYTAVLGVGFLCIAGSKQFQRRHLVAYLVAGVICTLNVALALSLF